MCSFSIQNLLVDFLFVKIFDLGSGCMSEEVAAHDNEIWAMSMSHDKRGLVTASGDKTVKFWNFELIAGEEGGGKQLSLSHVRTLQLGEFIRVKN